MYTLFMPRFGVSFALLCEYTVMETNKRERTVTYMTSNTPPESFGYLKFEVASGDGTIPIRDALIYVYSEEGDGSRARLLHSLTTDEDGLTRTIQLPAPPIAESLTPEMDTPYTSYYIVVKKPGFAEIEGREVPVFPGITSIQQINMIALPEPFAPTERTEEDREVSHD